MTDLDVRVRLQLQNLLSKEAKVAAKDMAAIGVAAGKINGKATGKFAGELGKAWTASVKLGGALDKTAIAAGKAGQGVTKIGQGAKDIDATRRKIDQLTRSNMALAMSQKKIASAAMIGGMSRYGARPGATALAGAAGFAAGRARGRSAHREALLEAASRVSGNGYLLGAGGAVIAGAAIGGTAAAAAGGMALATREAIKFEKAMADVKKKVSLDEGATWGDVEQTINKVSRELGIARGDTAALTAMAGQAGIAYKDLAGFMRLAAMTAVGWDIAPKDASERLAKIKAATQWSIAELQEFADKVNALGDSSASAERDIAEMFQRAASAAKAANVPLDTSLAVTTALNSIGMAEETAARFWNAFSSKLRTASDQPDKAAEGYKLLGLTVAQVERGMKTNATKTIIDLFDRLEKSSDKAKAAVKIFGQEWWDEAARAGQALPEIRKNLELLAGGKWKGSLQQNLEIDLSTTDNHLKRTGAMLSQIGDRLGRWTLPLINEGLEQTLKKWEKLDAARAAREQEASIVDKGARDALTPAEAERLSKDPALREKIAKQREAERQELESARYRRDKLAVQVSSARAAGSGSLADVPAMVAELRKLDAQIAYLERRVEAVKEKAAEAPKERTEGLRGGFGQPSQKIIDELIGKFKELDASMKTLDLFPNAEETRQKAAKLVDELTAVFQRADLSPEARKLIDSYAAGIGAQGGKVDAQAQAIRARIQQILGAPIVVKIEPRLSGAKGVGGSTGSGGGASGGATPRKTSARPAGDVHIREAHFHGVQNVAGLHRTLMAAADRRARAGRDNALHDVDVG